jgi:hypothetical protein
MNEAFMVYKGTLRLLLLCFAVIGCRMAQAADHSTSDSTIVAEAEEFAVQPSSKSGSGWKSKKWGENYYCATFGNTFLSRKAFLGAPEQSSHSTATLIVKIPKAGRYLALVRYEAVPRFQTQFHVRIEQAGKTKLNRLYGARENMKVWPYWERLKAEAFAPWGAVENVVWEGHDVLVELDAGEAQIVLTTGEQPQPAARRNVDLVMLTSDVQQVADRIDKDMYLPLDGMLTQSGDLYLKLHNAGASQIQLTVPPGTEHSPYWIHNRKWKPKTIDAAGGQSSDWVEVGSLLDSLNDGQWKLTAKGTGPLHYHIEFGVPAADGHFQSIRRIDDLNQEVVDLAYRADTRYSREVQTAQEVLSALVNYLKAQRVHGIPPRRTLVYGETFTSRPNDPTYNALVDEFVHLIGGTAFNAGSRTTSSQTLAARESIDFRDKPANELRTIAAKLKAEGRADKIAVISLGDEITLPAPSANANEPFRAWLKQRGVTPSGIDPAWGDDWSKVLWSPSADAAKSKPPLFYYSRLYQNHFGIAHQKALTEALKDSLPNALVGANFSPHHGHYYLGDTFSWVSLFREHGMTMPWTEDYIWQVPVGSQQMSFISLDMFRAGIKNQPDAKIHAYVMPHWPGNTTASWRRQFYGAIGHGAKIFNLFEFRPVQAAYTENHVSLPAMFQAVRQGLHELGTFEDIMQDGQVLPGIAALWFSETGDIWNNNASPFDAAKRSLYIAIWHQQLPLDVVVDADAVAGELKQYRVLYLTDQNVAQASSKAIAHWVNTGGRLFATAGAGMFDELNRPNETMRRLFGVDQKALDIGAHPVRLEKQDLPFAATIDQVTWTAAGRHTQIPVIDVRSRFGVRSGGGAAIAGTFSDGSPAITIRSSGKGRAIYCGFLPGLSYFKPAIPLRPVDRGTTDDSMAHFIPTNFESGAASLISAAASGVELPVICSDSLVETTVIKAKQGFVIPLVNWSGRPVKRLSLKLLLPGTVDAELASGSPIRRDGDHYIFDLDIADALILRGRSR